MEFFKFLMYSSVEKFDLVNFFEFTFYIFDLSFTNMLLYCLFTLFVLIWILNTSKVTFKGYNAFYIYRILNFIEEILFNFVFDILVKQIGKKGFIFFSFILSIFFTILIANIFGMFPYSFPITAHIVVTFFFSITVWMLSVWLGCDLNGFNFYKLFLPSAPLIMQPFLVVLEIISFIIRVFSLAIRLAANMTSGHVLMFTISNFLTKLLEFNIFIAIFMIFVLCFILALEFGVAFLQAYVFVTLTCIYLNDSINIGH